MSASDLGQVGERFKSNLLNNPKASAGRVHGTFQPPVPMAKAKALMHRLIQFNGPRYTTYLVFDVDRQGGAHAWQDAGLPRPTLTIINPRNGFAHLAYELTQPVRLDNMKSTAYLDAIRAAMRRALGADPNYRGNLTKNPYHADWHVETHDHTYRFDELAEHLDLTRPTNRTRKTKRKSSSWGNPTSRNFILRDQLTQWACMNVRNYPDQSAFGFALTEQAEQVNEQFVSGPKGRLTQGEVRKWVRWISRWFWLQYQEGKFRGSTTTRDRKLNLPADWSLRERQQHGQEYTAQRRVARSEDKIEHAILTLRSEGKAINKSAIARLAGLNRRTVIRHYDAVLDSMDQQPRSIDDIHIDESIIKPDILQPVSPMILPPAGPVTRTVTWTDTERVIACLRHRLFHREAAPPGAGVSSTAKCTPPTHPPMTYPEARLHYDDGGPQGNVKGIVHAHGYARQMALDHHVIIDGLPSSTRSLLVRMIVQQVEAAIAGDHKPA